MRMCLKSLFCAFSRCLLVAFAGFCAFGFVNRLQVLFPRLTLENPRNPLKILPRDLRNLHKIRSRFVQNVNLCKSFCYFWLLPKVESPLPLNPNLPIAQSKQIVGDSRIAKMDSSLTAFAQNDESVDCHDFATQNLAMTGVLESALDSPKSELKRN